MPTNTQLMTQIDADITDKVEALSISPIDVGDNMKATIMYTDQEIAALGLNYKNYSAKVNQTGTSIPTAIVFNNTLGGTIVFSRLDTGAYFLTLNNAFVNNKCWEVIATSPVSDSTIVLQRQNVNVYQISTMQGGIASDDILQNVSLEIRVYN